ncbi:MAG: cell wall hydrolase [Sphingopyxis sp.]
MTKNSTNPATALPASGQWRSVPEAGWRSAPEAGWRSAPTKRGHVLRNWLAAILLIPIILFGSREVLGRTAFATPYRVSVPVTLHPHDPQLWSLVNADDFAAAQAIDAELPDPLSVQALGEASVTAPTINAASLRQEAYVGPAAQRTVFRGATSTDTARAHYCLTAALYYEAASESDDGMRGVAQVVLNRVRHPSFPGSVCGVVFQGSQRAIVCQFTFSCDGAMARAPSRPNWSRASRIAAEALSGRTFPAVGLATHYHTQAIWPSWGRSLAMTNIVGAHIFHRWRGRWGMPAAFSRPYSGHEPVPGPYLPIAAQLAARAGRSSPALSPLVPVVASIPGAADAATMAAIARSSPVGTVAPVVTAQPGFTPLAPVSARPEPHYTDPRLSGSGSIREEYRNSGAPVAR